MGNIYSGYIYKQYTADELFRHVFVYRLLRPNKNIPRLGHGRYFRSDYDDDTELHNLSFRLSTSRPRTSAVYRLHSSHCGLRAIGRNVCRAIQPPAVLRIRHIPAFDYS